MKIFLKIILKIFRIFSIVLCGNLKTKTSEIPSGIRPKIPSRFSSWIFSNKFKEIIWKFSFTDCCRNSCRGSFRNSLGIYQRDLQSAGIPKGIPSSRNFLKLLHYISPEIYPRVPSGKFPWINSEIPSLENLTGFRRTFYREAIRKFSKDSLKKNLKRFISKLLQ